MAGQTAHPEVQGGPQPGGPAPTSPAASKKKRRGIRGLLLGIGFFPLAFAIILGILGGVGAFTFGYGKGFSYMLDDPKACANCHVMQEHYDSWQKSSHHHVATCNSCHLPHDFVGKWYVKSDNGFFHSLAFTLENYHDPIQIKPRNRKVTQNACMSCHQDIVHQMLPEDPKGEMLNCIQCHNDVGHAGRRRGSTGLIPQEPFKPNE